VGGGKPIYLMALHPQTCSEIGRDNCCTNYWTNWNIKSELSELLIGAVNENNVLPICAGIALLRHSWVLYLSLLLLFTTSG